MRAAVLLAELNDTDLAIDAVQTRLAEIAAALKEPAEIRAARAVLVQAENELIRWQEIQVQREKSQSEAASRLAGAQRKLYGGRVNDPKELTNVQADVDQQQRQTAQRDEELLEALLSVEKAVEDAKAGRLLLTGLMESRGAAVTQLRSEGVQLQNRLGGLQARRTAARQAISEPLILIYDRLRPRRAGRAVAMLDGVICSACRVAASPTKVEAARYAEELVYCENCGRILWGE